MVDTLDWYVSVEFVWYLSHKYVAFKLYVSVPDASSALPFATAKVYAAGLITEEK